MSENKNIFPEQQKPFMCETYLEDLQKGRDYINDSEEIHKELAIKRLNWKARQGYDQVPERFQWLYLECHTLKTGYPLRIELHCLRCRRWQRSEVANCKYEACEFHDVRPYKRHEFK